MTFAQCIRWLPFPGPEIIPPSPSAIVPHRTFRRPPKPTPTRPLLSRENPERHVSFSLDAPTGRGVTQPFPPSTESITCTTASFSSADSTLCSSPLSDLGDLPPLKNLPPLLFDPQTPEQIQARRRPMTANFPIKARNPFRFRRTSTSSAPSPTPEIGEILPVYPSIDSSPYPLEPGPRKPSLIKRLNMKGRRAFSVNAVTECKRFPLRLIPSRRPNNSLQLHLAFPGHPGCRRRHSVTQQIPQEGLHLWTFQRKCSAPLPLLRCFRNRGPLGVPSLVVLQDREQCPLHQHLHEPNLTALHIIAHSLFHVLGGQVVPGDQLPPHKLQYLQSIKRKNPGSTSEHQFPIVTPLNSRPVSKRALTMRLIRTHRVYTPERPPDVLHYITILSMHTSR